MNKIFCDLSNRAEFLWFTRFEAAQRPCTTFRRPARPARQQVSPNSRGWSFSFLWVETTILQEFITLKKIIFWTAKLKIPLYKKKTRYRSTIQFRNSIFLISTQYQKCNFTVNFLEWRIRARTRTWFSSAFSFRRNSKKTGSFHQTTFAEIRFNPSWKINKILILTIFSNIVWQSESKNKKLIVKNKLKIFFQDKTKSEGKS